jgi:hypothetical protein
MHLSVIPKHRTKCTVRKLKQNDGAIICVVMEEDMRVQLFRTAGCWNTAVS